MKIKNNFLRAAAFLSLVFFASLPCFAQTAQTSTTLSAAITSTSATTISLTSVSGISCPVNQSCSQIFVDRELMQVISVNTAANTVQVVRGAEGTRAFYHLAGSTVYYGPGNNFSANYEWGACSPTSELYLPHIDYVTGDIFDCRVASGTPTSTSTAQWIRIQDGTMASAGSTIDRFCTGVPTSAATVYLNGAACTTTTITTTYIVNNPGVLATLRVASSAAVTGGSSVDVATVYVNGSATGLTCTIAAAGKTCSDVAHSIVVAPGAVVAIQFIAATSDTAANISATVGVY